MTHLYEEGRVPGIGDIHNDWIDVQHFATRIPQAGAVGGRRGLGTRQTGESAVVKDVINEGTLRFSYQQPAAKSTALDVLPAAVNGHGDT